MTVCIHEPRPAGVMLRRGGMVVEMRPPSKWAAVSDPRFWGVGFELDLYAAIVVCLRMDEVVESYEVFPAPGGFRFRLPGGYKSQTVFATEKEVRHCAHVAFWRHINFPEDYRLV